jgi:hypothetical protein
MRLTNQSRRRLPRDLRSLGRDKCEKVVAVDLRDASGGGSRDSADRVAVIAASIFIASMVAIVSPAR